jgi:hypothetical protein
VGVEVAVGALLDTPGHVDIEGEGRQLQHGVSSIQQSKGVGLPLSSMTTGRGAANETGADGPHCR